MPRTFGIELEFVRTGGNVAINRICRELTEAGVPCYFESYNHRTRDHWKIVTDSSCGYELVSPILEGESGREQVRKACEVLRSLRIRTNSNCGFHVHIGASDLTVNSLRNVCKLHLRHEGVMDKTFPSDRIQNRFCQSNLNAFMFDESVGSYTRLSPLDALRQAFNRLDTARSHDSIRAVMGMERYRKLNLKAFAQHGTVEFRQHGATIDANTILNWVEVCMKLVEKAAATSTVKVWNKGEDVRADRRVKYALEVLGVSAPVVEYFVRKVPVTPTPRRAPQTRRSPSLEASNRIANILANREDAMTTDPFTF